MAEPSVDSTLDPALLEILACPDTHHAPLTYDPAAQTLTCTECKRVFPIRDGIPVLLLDEATLPADGDSAPTPASGQ
ncbi:MAG TPA: Trm112 family protein [Natronosporangium sp.]